MSSENVTIDRLKGNVEQLISKCDGLQQQKAILQNANIQLEQSINEQKSEIKELFDKYELLKMAQSLGGGEEKNTETKLKINELVREIDKCISLLNK